MKQHIQLFLLLLSLLFSSGLQAQFYRLYDPGSTSVSWPHWAEGIPTTDGGYAILHQGDGQFPFGLIKTDLWGDTLWTQSYALTGDFNYGTPLAQTQDGGYILLGRKYDNGVYPYVIKTNALGQIEWTHTGTRIVREMRAITPLHDGGYAFCGAVPVPGSSLPKKNILVRLNPIGDTLWTRTWGGNRLEYSSYSVIETDNHDLVVGAEMADYNTQWEWGQQISRFDSLGNLLWSQESFVNSQFQLINEMIPTQNGGYAMVGHRWEAGLANKNGILLLADSMGLATADYTYSFPDTSEFQSVAQTPDGGFAIGGLRKGDFLLVRTDPQGDTLWTHSIGTPDQEEIAYSIAALSNGGFMLAGYSYYPYLPMLVVTDSLGQVPGSRIQGTAYEDLNANCQQDPNEPPIPGLLVQISDPLLSQHFSVLTDANGHYSIDLPFSTYQVNAPGTSPYRQFLCPNPGPHLLDSLPVTVDFPAEITAYCPLNQVSITSSPFRLTTPSAISVRACNLGTVPSYPTFVEVELDPDFTLVSSSLPPVSQVGQLLTFALDTLYPGACKLIQLSVQLGTTAQLGETHCVEARIYPDTLCVQPGWNGPIITARAECLTDSVHFILENIGAHMQTGRGVSVYVDDVIFLNGNFQLDSAEMDTLRILADTGATYRIEAMQAPGFPALLGDSIAIAFIEGCVPYPNGSFNTGFVTQFYLGNSSPFIEILCEENRFSFDPNDKLAQPEGYGPQHLIYNATPLDYQIRFQNTGTDTAFRVMLLDTLSPLLDLSTLEIGAASHPFRWDIIGQNVLRFIFQPIQLPDSNVNEPASQGSVRFRIQPLPNLSDGTLISNRAGIYFDFNAPIITPTIFHTIGSDFVPRNIVNALTETDIPTLAVKVWPNPTQQLVSFQVEGVAVRQLSLELFDTQGKRVQAQYEQVGAQLHIRSVNWQQGLYLYRLWDGERLLGTGKLLVEP